MIRTSLMLQTLLVVLGLLQTASYVFQFSKLRGLAVATTASPLPLVFSHFRGLETYSSTFVARVEVEKEAGLQKIELPITPEVYANLPGAYNRRNAYGAVIAYGAKLTEENEPKLVQAVLRHGLCGNSPLARSLGVNDRVLRATIEIENVRQYPPFRGEILVECAL